MSVKDYGLAVLSKCAEYINGNLTEMYLKVKNPDGETIDISGDITPTGLRNAGRTTEVSLSAGSYTKIPASALTDLNSVAVQNQSDNGAIIVVDYTDNGATAKGWRIYDGGYKEYPIQETIDLYATIAVIDGSPASGTILVEEIS